MVDADGVEVPGTRTTSTAAGQEIVIQETGLAPGTYWVHVVGPGSQEGEYCLNPDWAAGELCTDGGGGTPT